MTLESSLFKYAKAKEDAKDVAKQVADSEKELIEAMQRQGLKKIAIGTDELTGTLVEGETVTIDDQKLLESLTPAQQKAVTKTVLDKEKLEAMIALGKITAVQVAMHTEVKPKKSYVLVKGTTKAVTEDISLLGVKPLRKVVARKPKAQP